MKKYVMRQDSPRLACFYFISRCCYLHYYVGFVRCCELLLSSSLSSFSLLLYSFKNKSDGRDVSFLVMRLISAEEGLCFIDIIVAALV